MPKTISNAVGISKIQNTWKKLLKYDGLSKGWAELALKQERPFSPMSLIASNEATGPSSNVSFTFSIVSYEIDVVNVFGVPNDTKTMLEIIDKGKSILTIAFIIST